MLQKQKNPVEFSGGLEAKLLKDWHVSLLWDLRPKQMFFAYDTPDDLEPLVEAGKKLNYANFTRNHCRCYVLIGYENDTFAKAKKRLLKTWEVGFMPMAMLYIGEDGYADKEWRKFQRLWDRPAITKSIIKDDFKQKLKEQTHEQD